MVEIWVACAVDQSDSSLASFFYTTYQSSSQLARRSTMSQSRVLPRTRIHQWVERAASRQYRSRGSSLGCPLPAAEALQLVGIGMWLSLPGIVSWITAETELPHCQTTASLQTGFYGLMLAHGSEE
jgi:hypothetical protein